MNLLYDSLIHFDNIGLRYNNNPEVLTNITFSINKGDFFYLTGASGSGKTSLIRLMNMTLKPTRGFINIFSRDLNSITTKEIYNIRRKIGVIFQDYKLINNISVFDNIALPLKIINSPKEEIKEKVEIILSWLELEQYKDEYPLSLSGGQQQMISIARAVITDPELILADEATGSVDNKMAQKIIKLLLELNSKGTTIIFATHNINLIKDNPQKVLLLKNHNIELIEKPKKNYEY